MVKIKTSIEQNTKYFYEISYSKDENLEIKPNNITVGYKISYSKDENTLITYLSSRSRYEIS